VLHVPIIEISDAILKRVFPALHLWVISGSAVVALLILCCWFIDSCYDVPVRRWMTHHLTRRSVIPVGTRI
jgi:peptidoglycan/LPS O-acetylase OafA/YrhL